MNGLDKCSLKLTGVERARFCQQRSDEPKKAKNNSLISKESILHQASFDIHDFQGHMSLNGGTYKMPFNVEVP